MYKYEGNPADSKAKNVARHSRKGNGVLRNALPSPKAQGISAVHRILNTLDVVAFSTNQKKKKPQFHNIRAVMSH